METINNKIEEKVNAFMNQLARYVGATCYTYTWSRFACPEDMWVDGQTRSGAINDAEHGCISIEQYEEICRREYAEDEEAENLAEGIAWRLERVDYNDEFDEFVEEFDLEENTILCKIINFITFANDVMIFKAPCYCQSEIGDEMYTSADRFALLRVTMSILLSKKKEIIDTIAKLSTSEKEAINRVDCFFIDIYRFVSRNKGDVDDNMEDYFITSSHVEEFYGHEYDEDDDDDEDDEQSFAEKHANTLYESRKDDFKAYSEYSSNYCDFGDADPKKSYEDYLLE